jgi:UDP-galactopyranose mutase
MKNAVNHVIGAGITGITIARRLAESGESVLLTEKTDRIGGNCHDFFDHNGCYVQSCGPHIFHTSDREVWDFISRFTAWNGYTHKVLAHVDGKLIPVPFNLKSLRISFPLDYERIARKLIERTNGGTLSVMELKDDPDNDLKALGEYVYKKIYLNYTIKQWGFAPEELDPTVVDRVPVYAGEDDRYFRDDLFQGIPSDGYSALFARMLSHKNIRLMLGTDYKEISPASHLRTFVTSPLDEYLSYEFGPIEYRRIHLKFEEHRCNSFQENSVINYPNEYDYTRVTEYNKFLGNAMNRTITSKEYTSRDNGYPAYPVLTKQNKEVIAKYLKKAEGLENTYFAGRLAECRYYDMDDACRRGLDLCAALLK